MFVYRLLGVETGNLLDFGGVSLNNLTLASEKFHASLTIPNTSWMRAIGMLFARPVLFALWQFAFALAFAWRGYLNPWQAATAWWPWSGILTSLVILVLLAWLFRSEGSSLLDLYRFDRQHLKGDLLIVFGFFIIAGPIGFLPNLLFGNLLFGSAQKASAIMFLRLPVWAAASALIIFPVMIALTELPTYFGYSMPRIKILSGKTWLAICLPAFFLAAQHMALPLIFDPRYLAWRLMMFLPFALLVAVMLYWRPRLMPYLIIIHILIDIPTMWFVLQSAM
jgi:hypothetical protein